MKKEKSEKKKNIAHVVSVTISPENYKVLIANYEAFLAVKGLEKDMLSIQKYCLMMILQKTNKEV